MSDTAEVAQLGDGLSGGVDYDNLIALIGRDPEIVVVVDEQAIGPVDAVGKYRRRAGRCSRDGNLYDGVVASIRDEHCVLVLVESEPVRAKRWNTRSPQQCVIYPSGSNASFRRSHPDDSLKRVGHVDVPCLVK